MGQMRQMGIFISEFNEFRDFSIAKFSILLKFAINSQLKKNYSLLSTLYQKLLSSICNSLIISKLSPIEVVGRAMVATTLYIRLQN